MARPIILVSNDDGIYAPGIEALAEMVAEFGDVYVSAPAGERSAQSHAITLHAHLRAQEIKPRWHAVTGTPVDSVYLGALHACPRLPDLVVSGVNNGFNLGTDVYYSGTVGAAREGRLRGASAIAFSVDYHADPRILEPTVRALVPAVLERHRDGERHLLNVNAPTAPNNPTAPPQVCRLGRRRYRDRVEKRHDLMGRPYFWIGGPADQQGDVLGEDTYAVHHGHISVTPLTIDDTADSLKTWSDEIDRRFDP